MNRSFTACIAGMLLFAAGCGGGSKDYGWKLDPLTSAPDLPLAGAGGDSLSLARPGGRLSLVTFGYTACPDVCPSTLADWRKLRRGLGADTSRVRFVFVSVDWKNDTPEVAAAFARRFDPAFLGVTADSAELRMLLPAFRAEAAYDTAAGGTANVSHTDYTYLVDDSSRIALAYDFAAPPSKIADDVRRMLRRRATR